MMGAFFNPQMQGCLQAGFGAAQFIGGMALMGMGLAAATTGIGAPMGSAVVLVGRSLRDSRRGF